MADMTVEQANIVSSLQSMRDRMMRELPKKYGDGFDGDMDTLLEAINSIKKQAKALATLRAELDGLRAKSSRAYVAEQMRGLVPAEYFPESGSTYHYTAASHKNACSAETLANIERWEKQK